MSNVLICNAGSSSGLVFTAGVGEHAPVIRQQICPNLGHLGLDLDQRANAECKPDADLATRPSKGRILVIATRGDRAIVREVRRLIPARNKEGELS